MQAEKEKKHELSMSFKHFKAMLVKDYMVITTE